MPNPNNTFRSALMVSAAIAATVGLSAGAMAADDSVETVVVTGTRIASTDAMSAAPISLITPESIQKSKSVTLEQVLNKIPAVSQTGSTDQNSISPGGIATADLRGLGSNRTLVLINGERMVDTFVNGGQGQDLANIPMSMIDHIEVLKDGASPIYGADAIGGVINIITKTDFNGLQVDAGGGISTYGDHASQQISATMGFSGDKSNVIFSLEYSSEDPVRQSQRKWAHDVNKYTYSSFVPQAQYIGETSGNYYTGASDGSISETDDWSHFDTGERSDLIQGRGIINATLNASYQINPFVTVFAESYFTNRKSSAVLNPMPVGVATTAKWMDGLTIPADNENNTTGEDLKVYKRLTEVGNRVFSDNVNTFQERIGAKGAYQGWNWQVGYIYGESDGTDSEKNAINLTKLQELVGNYACEEGAPDNCGSVTLSGTSSLTDDDVDFISYTSEATSRYVQQIAYADISGELPVALPGGNVGVAFGVMYRDEAVKNTPDAVSQAGDAAESNSQVTQGNYNVKEAYLEAKLPVLHNALFAKDLSFDFAGRYSYYSLAGHGVTYKGSVNWAINDVIRFRGDYGTGERAPQVGSEMFLGDTASADAFTDPCETPSNSTVAANCKTAGAYVSKAEGEFTQTTTQLTAIWEGNSDLKPEKSIQYNLGVVITPDFLVPNLTLTMDYYNIHLKDMISQVSATQALKMCYESADMDSSPYCANFEARDSTTGQLTTYYEKYMNLGWEHVDGVDFGVTYNSESLADLVGLPSGSVFAFAINGNWLNNMFEENLDGTVTNYAGGWVDDAISYAYPKWKGNLNVSLYLPSGASVDVTERFIGAQHYYDSEYRSYADMHVPALVYTDFSFSVPWDNYSATFGIDNVFDKDPPLVEDSYVQTVSNQYDMVGRYFFLKVSAKY